MKIKKAIIREYIETIIIAVVLALFIRTFIIQSFKIPSDSMFPTFMSKPINDRIMVNKFIYRFHRPERGDIIVFRAPKQPEKYFIKRLIALGGEEVEIKGGDIYIDNLKISEPEEIANVYYSSEGYYGSGKVEVPVGHFFVLGDNTLNSEDSRYWGFVPEKNIQGKAMFIFWPPYRIARVK